MQASIKLGRIFGIEIGLHYSWLLIALLIAFSLAGHFGAAHPGWEPRVIWGMALVTAALFFAAIVAHELSHALVAIRRGLPVRSIVLFALGGVAQLEKDAEDARTEFSVAVVGPLASALIGFLCLGLAGLLGWTLMTEPTTPLMAMLVWLGYINIGLAVFNMIPGFPMDGGRVLRAIIWWKTGNAARATRTAARTGRLPIRTGMYSDTRRVLFPDSAEGLPSSEITIAELLKTRGYATAAIGKWHLGHRPEYLPMRQGFDSYFGIPYSNDMDATYSLTPRENYFRSLKNPKREYWNVPLMRNEQIIERPADQTTITERYTDEAIKFIRASRNKPFFLYLAHSMPHVPLFRSKAFEGKSIRGLYGDVIEELDASVGRVLDALRQLKLERNTLVVFTSDNGPWALFDEQGGSAGLLRGAKGGTYEGGMRVPAIFWQPGKIKPGVVMEMGATLDLLPTFCALAGVPAPADRALDGYDLSAALSGNGHSPRQMMPYWRGSKLYALRHGAFKAHFITQSEYGGEPAVTHETPELYNLEVDPSEKWNIAAQHPEIVAELRRLAEQHRKAIPPAENHLDKRITANRR